MTFTDNPEHVNLADMIGRECIVQVFGKLVLDEYNPFAAPRPSGKRTRGIMLEHSASEVKVGEVVFRADHVSYTTTALREVGYLEIYHLHRGHRDEYEYGAPK